MKTQSLQSGSIAPVENTEIYMVSQFMHIHIPVSTFSEFRSRVWKIHKKKKGKKKGGGGADLGQHSLGPLASSFMHLTCQIGG